MTIYPDINGQLPIGRMGEAQPDRVTMRLLVIEDDRDAADYLVKAFREVGHVADAATDGDADAAQKGGDQRGVNCLAQFGAPDLGQVSQGDADNERGFYPFTESDKESPEHFRKDL